MVSSTRQPLTLCINSPQQECLSCTNLHMVLLYLLQEPPKAMRGALHLPL
jgi:hypothetical protein